jgi:FkbM family methyltransferase
MREVNGWWLPDDNRYFDKFFVGKAPKENGFQREHLEMAFQYVKKWDYAIDVGAHVGFWAKDMADKFGMVYCFEPVSSNFACLAKNMAEYSNVVLSCVAIGDKPGMCAMLKDVRKANSGSEYVTPDSRGQVRMCRLDDLELPGCDLIKIDVEGFELAVLRGAKKLFEDCRPVVIMECNKKFANRFKWTDSAAQEFLTKRGYTEVAYMRPDKVFVHSG